ncbi:MAG: lysophospholipid acyltransferase family protein [bacterium]
MREKAGGSFKDFLDRLTGKGLRERIESLPVETIPGTEYDPFGFSKRDLAAVAPLLSLIYRFWHRVEVEGIERVPAEGPALIISNHSGMFPMDAAMIVGSMILEAEPPRLVRSMVDRFVPSIPFISSFFSRTGQVVGTPGNAELMLSRGEVVLIFPEGARGTGKTFDRRYRLEPFSPGFVELSIMHRAPIVPTAVIGAEEQQPILYDAKPLARALGAPYFPITPTFPWLGPLGAFSLPSKYHIYYGEPIRFYEQYDKNVLDDPATIRALMERARERVQEIIREGLEKRPVPFFT